MKIVVDAPYLGALIVWYKCELGASSPWLQLEVEMVMLVHRRFGKVWHNEVGSDSGQEPGPNGMPVWMSHLLQSVSASNSVAHGSSFFIRVNADEDYLLKRTDKERGAHHCEFTIEGLQPPEGKAHQAHS